jgi:hypothetical protein
MSFRSFIESLITEPRKPVWSYQVLEVGKTFLKKGMCPYCGGDLEVFGTGWELDETGLWVLVLLEADCSDEPDTEIDHVAWLRWLVEHSHEPYVYQLPVEIEIGKWITANYRFYFSEN